MYTSTRKKINLSASKCIIKGISDEGGLFIFNKLNDFSFDKSFINYSYQELSYKILKHFLDDFDDKELNKIIGCAYNKTNFKDKIIGFKHVDKMSFLELYHGPTMAFKDMALTILPHLMSTAKKKNSDLKKTLILTATSGDTGGAALAGFSKSEDCKIIVLYPTEGISEFQKAQMHFYESENAKVIAINGNFDDCQNLVKNIFTMNKVYENIELSSANSINIGRLVPQTIYYFYGYLEMVKENRIEFGQKINVVVPTGNFGNILACYIAKKMGLYVNKIVCASNENSVLTDFFNTYRYDRKRKFYLTNSPAMDILISSNLERLLYLICDESTDVVNGLMNDLKEKGEYMLPKKYQNRLDDFLAVSVSNEETKAYIKKCYKENNYLIDPHTAVAYGAYDKLKNHLEGNTLIVSTASGFKFIETIDEIFDTKKEGLDRVVEISKITSNQIPSILFDIYNNEYSSKVWQKEEMEEKLLKLIGEINENC